MMPYTGRRTQTHTHTHTHTYTDTRKTTLNQTLQYQKISSCSCPAVKRLSQTTLRAINTCRDATMKRLLNSAYCTVPSNGPTGRPTCLIVADAVEKNRVKARTFKSEDLTSKASHDQGFDFQDQGHDFKGQGQRLDLQGQGRGSTEACLVDVTVS